MVKASNKSWIISADFNASGGPFTKTKIPRLDILPEVAKERLYKKHCF